MMDDVIHLRKGGI